MKESFSLAGNKFLLTIDFFKACSCAVKKKLGFFLRKNFPAVYHVLAEMRYKIKTSAPCRIGQKAKNFHIMNEYFKPLKRISFNQSYFSKSCTVLNRGACLPKDLACESEIFSLPVDYYLLEDLVALGMSDLFYMKDAVFTTHFMDLRRHICSEEAQGILRLSRKKKKSFIKKNIFDFKLKTEEALHLLGSTTINYAHWLTEYLPKLLFLDDFYLKNVPVILDAGLSKNFLEGVDLLLGAQHPKIFLKKHEPIQIKKAHVIDLGMSVPFGFVNPKRPDINQSDAVFSVEAIKRLRNYCLKKCDVFEKTNKKKKIFVLRQSNYRFVLNVNEVLEQIQAMGYEICLPEMLSFEDQIILFSKAQCLVGQTGAGMANMIFSPTGCRVLLFATNLHLGNYKYYQNLAAICGHKVAFLEGMADQENNVHANYSLDPDHLRAALMNMES